MRTYPSLKEKRRYLVFEIISDRKASFEEVKHAIHDSALGFMGRLGMAKAKLRFISDKWDLEKQTGVLITERKSLDKIRASLCLTTKIGINKAIITSVASSGILKKALSRHD